MEWGMKNRMSKLIKEDGRCFFLPIDHGYFQGPTSCLEKPAKTIAPILEYADALFVTRGVLRSCIDTKLDKPVILRVSGCTSMVGKDLANEEITTSIEEIIRLNAASVGVSVFVGSDYERQTLLNLSKIVNACENYGIPVMAAELGARVVKTYWCEKDFDKVVAGCPVPVVMAGGPKCETEKEVFDFVYDGIQKGSCGINLGRNVWQNPNPAAVAKGLHAIIHKNATSKDAFEIFNEAKKK